MQQGLGYTALQAGYLSITYLIMVLLMIRVGEKLLQKMGSKRPMLLGTFIVVIGAVYAGAVAVTSIHTGAMIALWVNVLMGIMAFIAILFAIPNDDKRVKDAK